MVPYLAFVAGAVATGVLIISIYQIVRKQNKYNRYDYRRIPREAFSDSEQRQKPEVTKEILEERKKECWAKQCELEQREKMYKTYRKIFFDDAVLYSFQYLAGFCHYEIESMTDSERFRDKAFFLTNNMNNGILRCFKQENGRYMPSVTANSNTGENEAVFYRNTGLDMNCVSGSDRQILLDNIKETKTSIERARIELDTDSNNVFYKKLWDNTHEHIENLVFALDLSSGDLQAQKSRLKTAFSKLETSLTGCGISVIYPENQDDAYQFIASEKERLPALLRGSDGHVFYKGKRRMA